MFAVRNERGIQFSCPVCGATIVWDIDVGASPIICPKCHAAVEVPASVKQDAQLFKIADALRKK